jgi:hypothetical protein
MSYKHKNLHWTLPVLTVDDRKLYVNTSVAPAQVPILWSNSSCCVNIDIIVFSLNSARTTLIFSKKLLRTTNYHHTTGARGTPRTYHPLFFFSSNQSILPYLLIIHRSIDTNNPWIISIYIRSTHAICC